MMKMLGFSEITGKRCNWRGGLGIVSASFMDDLLLED